MRPVISDSLISGQPLNLLYSYWKPGVPAAALLAFSRATQATGRVRLHVTGSPPTCRTPCLRSEHEDRPNGSAVAKTACKNCLRPITLVVTASSHRRCPPVSTHSSGTCGIGSKTGFSEVANLVGLIESVRKNLVADFVCADVDVRPENACIAVEILRGQSSGR